MQPYQPQSGIVMPLDRSNVDTDMIIPKQFLKSIKRTGFGPYLFDELRYLDQGYVGKDCRQRPLNPDFILNQPRYREASILLTRQNFGCGSSREHAPWALENFGFRVLIGPSFADIFFNNAFKNGLLLITLDEATVDQLFSEVESEVGYRLTVDLEHQQITTPSGQTIDFEVDPFRKHCLLNGLDDIAITLEQADAIRQFEVSHREKQPWLFH